MLTTIFPLCLQTLVSRALDWCKECSLHIYSINCNYDPFCFQWPDNISHNSENAWYGGTVGSDEASKLQGAQFDPELGLKSVWSPPFTPHVCVGFLWILGLPLTVQNYTGRGIGFATLRVTVCVCVRLYLWENSTLLWTPIPFWDGFFCLEPSVPGTCSG